MDKSMKSTKENRKYLLEDQVTLSNKLKSMEKEAESLKDQVKRQETILEKTRKENKRLIEKIADQDQLIRGHEIVIGNFYPNLRNITGNMQQGSRILSLNERVQHLETETDSLIEQMNKTGGKENNVERLKTLERDVSRLESENEDLAEQKKTLERDLHSMTIENEQVRESFQKLENFMHEKTSTDYVAISGELKKLKIENKRLEWENKDLRATALETVQKLETTSQEVNNTTANNEDNAVAKFTKLQKDFWRIESENEELLQKNLRIERQSRSLLVENERQREMIQKYKQMNADQFDTEMFKSEVNTILSEDEISEISASIGTKTLIDKLFCENRALTIAMNSQQSLLEQFKNANKLEPPADLKVKIESLIKENSKLNKELDEVYRLFAIEKTSTNMSIIPARITFHIINENKRLRSEIKILQTSKTQPQDLKKYQNKLQSVEKENSKLKEDKKKLMEDKNKLNLEITKLKTIENTSQPADVDQTNTTPKLELKNEKELVKLKLENSRLTQELQKMENSLEKEKTLAKDLKDSLELKIEDKDLKFKKFEDDLKSAIANRDDIQKKLYACEREIRRLTLENSDIRRENEAMYEGLTNKNKEIKMLQTKLIEVVQIRDIQLQNLLTTHTEEMIKLNSAIDDVKSENKKIKADLENERKILVKEQKLKTELDKRYQKLQNTHHKTYNTLEINKERQTELENDLKKLDEEKGQINLQLKEKIREISQLQDQVQRLQYQVEESKDYERLQNTIEKNTQLENELLHLKNSEEKLKLALTKNEQLEHEVDFYKTEIKSFEKKLNQMKTEGKRLLENLKSDKQQLRREKKELSIEKNEMEMKFKSDIEKLQSQLEYIMVKNNDTEKHDVSVQTKEKYMEELAVLQQQNQYQQTEIETYSTIILIKEEEIESLHNDLKSKESENNRLVGDLEGMELRITIMYRQLEHFKKSLPSWIENLDQISEFLNNSFMYNRRRSEIGVVISEMLTINYDLGKSLKFFDKTKNVKLSHYHDVIRELVETELSCSICTDTLKEAVTLKCSHTFCEKCLETWKNTKRECPMCRANFVSQYKTPLIDNVIEKMMACFPKESQTDQNSDHYDEDFPALN